MVRDSAATKARILDAAVDEFAAFGLAGARIDRIAESAEANKRSIYVYFENKELLFGAALDQVLTNLTTAVPLTEQDLPGYAGRMFDYLLRHPGALRITLWRQLERPATGPDASTLYADKIAKMSRRTADGGFDPTDLIVLIQGLVGAWLISPADLLAADGRDPQSAERIASHRAAVVEAARRLCVFTPSRKQKVTS